VAAVLRVSEARPYDRFPGLAVVSLNAAAIGLSKLPAVSMRGERGCPVANPESRKLRVNEWGQGNSGQRSYPIIML